MLEIKDIEYSMNDDTVISSLSLDIPDKGIFGILCADAEQKNVLADIICGCRDADAGEVLISSVPMRRADKQLKKKVRLVPEELVLPSTATMLEYLDFVGDALGVLPEKRYRQIKEALELLEIDRLKNKPFSDLRAADICRLSIAAALIGNPDIIVFNEVFSALGDSELGSIFDVCEMLGKIKTLIILSHKPNEIKKLCHSVAVMCGGKVVLSGNIDDIEQKINSTHELRITVRGNIKSITDTLRGVANVVSVNILSTEKNDVHLIAVEHYPDRSMKDTVFNALSNINAPMLSVKEVKLSLLDVYYSLTAPDVQRLSAKEKNGDSAQEV